MKFVIISILLIIFGGIVIADLEESVKIDTTERIKIRADAGQIIDDEGLGSTVNFISKQVTNTATDQTLTGDHEFQDLDDLWFNLNEADKLTKPTKVLFMVNLSIEIGGSDASAEIRIALDNTNTISYVPSEAGFISSGLLAPGLHLQAFSFSWIATVTPYLDNEIQVNLQGARSTPDEVIKILGLNGTSSFAYIILGK